MSCRKCVKFSKTRINFLNYLNPFFLLPNQNLILYLHTTCVILTYLGNSMNFREWLCGIAARTLQAYKVQIHMLLCLELRLEISIKYNLSITFAPKTLSLLVSPSLCFFSFFFIYLFCVVFELLPLRNELRFGEVYF